MNNQWYVHINGQQLGPYPWEELRRKAASHELAPSDHVWNQSLSGWVPAEQVPGLFPAQAPPPPPAAPYSAPAPVYSPSGPPLQPKRGVNTGLIAAVLVFLLLVGGGAAIYQFYIKGRGGGPAIGPSKGNDIVGAWYGTADEEEEGYIQFLNDGTMIMAVPSEGFWIQNPYRLVEDGGQLFLEVYDDSSEEWERDLEVSFPGKNSLNLSYIWDGDTITLERISEQQFQEVLGQLEFLEY